jgi:hypothetical protein
MSAWMAGLGAGLSTAGEQGMRMLQKREEERRRKEQEARLFGQQDFLNQLKLDELGYTPVGANDEAAINAAYGAMGAMPGQPPVRPTRVDTASSRMLDMPLAGGGTRKFRLDEERTPEGIKRRDRQDALRLQQEEAERGIEALVGNGYTREQATAIMQSPKELRSALLDRISPKPKDERSRLQLNERTGQIINLDTGEVTNVQGYRTPPTAASEKPTYDLDPVVTARADKLRSQYESNPYVKNASTIASQLMVVEGAAARPDAAGDLALIFGYMKILDPGSVVREGEFANAQNAAGVPDRIRNAYNKSLRGERLNESQRNQFLGQARNIAMQNRRLLQAQNERFSAIARQYQVDPSLVIDDPFAIFDAPPAAAGAAGGRPSVNRY